jgi:hypothetical protein
MAARTNWKDLRFEDAAELAEAARTYVRKRITADDIEAILGYQPAYDGYDLEEVLEAYGWRPRPKKGLVKRVVEMAGKAKAYLPPVEHLKSPGENLQPDIETFLTTVMPGFHKCSLDRWPTLTLEESAVWENAETVIRCALTTTANPEAVWQKLIEDLRARFPDRCPPLPEDEARDARDAFLAAWHEWKDLQEAWAKYPLYERAARRIARRVVNRSRRRKRRIRREYVEDVVFDYLWFGVPITREDLAPPYRSNWAWDRARRALDEALEILPPPRKFEAFVQAAHKLLGGSGSCCDPGYQTFRRLVYRHTTPSEREVLTKMEWAIELIAGDSQPIRFASVSSAMRAIRSLWKPPEAPPA